jgi:hypothetical protein
MENNHADFEVGMFDIWCVAAALLQAAAGAACVP